jgi:DNA-binding MarR family transcriptional regulator
MRMTNVRQTSIESYSSLKDLTGRQSQVLRALRSLGKACNADIATALGLPINQVTGRTMELRAKNLVAEAYRALYAPTGKRVIYWEVVA